jgi:hypothetical protein
LHTDYGTDSALPVGYVSNEGTGSSSILRSEAPKDGGGSSSCGDPQHNHGSHCHDVWVADITPHLPKKGAPNGLGSTIGPTTRVRLGNLNWSPDAPLLLADLLDLPAEAERSLHTLRVQQVKRLHQGFRLQIYGHTEDVTVLPPRVYGLSLHMLPKVVPDMSRLVVSPMPGALKSVAVKPGDIVEEGVEVAVIEA